MATEESRVGLNLQTGKSTSDADGVRNANDSTENQFNTAPTVYSLVQANASTRPGLSGLAIVGIHLGTFGLQPDVFLL